jgi:hypothetical protein
MKSRAVPQDKLAHYGDARKAMYATGDDGRYEVVASSGWQAEEAVTLDAVGEFDVLADQARVRALAGESSPLEFHMYACRMDPPLLAQSAGLWEWRVRRHLRASVFARLGEPLLRRYATALGIDVDRLKRLP